MSKYGDDYVCTCEMSLVSCRNKFHASTCELWIEPSFRDGHDEWDGDLGCLVLSRNPWDEAEEWIWNGDTPVVRKTTAEERSDEHDAIVEVVAEWESLTHETISPEEQEALDALCQGEKQDQYGMVALDDGSYADFEMRVTYRKLVVDGKPAWTEIFWDQKAKETAEARDEFVNSTGAAVTWRPCDCQPTKTYYCSVCHAQRDKETDPWRYWAGHASTNKSTGYSYSYGGGWGRCGHSFETFELPGSQHENIKISAKRMHTATTLPDFGLYAYAGWDPDCVATFIPWQDYGLPTCSYETAAQSIVDAWEKSCDGKTVEVGCMGGHGRTGTILGCLAILSNPEMSAKQAISWVRKVHCIEAIETNQQEWFIDWFRAWHLGESCPPKPTTYVSKHSANWKAAEGAAKVVKSSDPALPLTSTYQGPKTYQDAGTSTETTIRRWTWCSHCKRTVSLVHNAGCPFQPRDEVTSETGLGKWTDPTENVLQFDPELMTGETANARRRNAKRHNRRQARKARAAQRKTQSNIIQEYV